MSESPNAAIVVIGQELLSGKVQDCNGPYLLRGLRARGVEVLELRQLGDRVASIAAALSDLAGRVERILTTGGIGPTHDDVTIEAVALHLGRPLAVHPVLTAAWRARPAQAAPAADKGVLAPAGARVHTAAPGQAPFVPVVEAGRVWVLPGVPALMRACFEGLDVWGRGRAFVGEVLRFDVAEEALAAPLAALQADWPDIEVGSYPQPPGGDCRVAVTLDGRDAGRLQVCLDDARRRLPPHR